MRIYSGNAIGARGLIIFGMLFSGMGIFVFTMGAIPTIRYYASSDWVLVEARIKILEIVQHNDSGDGHTYSVHAEYEYDYEGKTYSGSRFSFDSGSDSNRQAKQDAVDRIKSDPKVWVNPRNPSESVMVRENVGASTALLFFGATFGLAGVMTLWMARTMAAGMKTWQMTKDVHLVPPVFPLSVLFAVNFAGTFVFALAAGFVSPIEGAGAWVLINAVALAAGWFYGNKSRRLLACTARFKSGAGRGEPTACELSFDFSEESDRNPAVRIWLLRKAKSGRNTKTCRLGEYPFNVTYDGLGRYVCVMPPKGKGGDSENFTDGKDELDEDDPDKLLGKRIGAMLTGERPTGQGALKEAMKTLLSDMELSFEMEIRCGKKKAAAALPRQFWTDIVAEANEDFQEA